MYTDPVPLARAESGFRTTADFFVSQDPRFWKAKKLKQWTVGRQAAAHQSKGPPKEQACVADFLGAQGPSVLLVLTFCPKERPWEHGSKNCWIIHSATTRTCS